MDERTNAWTEFGQCGKAPYWKRHAFKNLDAFAEFVAMHVREDEARHAAFLARHANK